MSITISRGMPDAIIEEIAEVLGRYETDRPAARIDLYRRNAVSVRIRVIDPEFAGKDKADRSEEVWAYLNELSEDAQGDISMVLLLTPDEMPKSMGNVEFEEPAPSMLD